MTMRLILLICLSFCVLIDAEENPQIKINDGKLKGSYMKSKEGRQIIAFQGIPYAEPPLGELRFKSPVPIKPWKGILDATQVHGVCPQMNIMLPTPALEGNENCLYLNVYTPKLPSNNDDLLPVMLFIHGGGFFIGTGNSLWYGPQVLLDRDVILVSINYRLGALGFLSTGDDTSPGNYGLKDQSFAIKWVKKNINNFGGNPEKITIFGESAGAASASYHLFSPLSKGLFKGVISQSGLPLCNWAFDHIGENVKNTKKLAKLLNCPTTSSAELVECLRDVEIEKIISNEMKFLEWDLDPLVLFKPVAEASSPEAFLLDDPANLLKAGKFEDVPLLTGITREDGVVRAATFNKFPERFDEFSEDFNHKVGLTLQLKTKNLDVVAEEIRKFYFGGKTQLNKKNSMSDLINMFTDGYFTNCLAETDRLHLKVSKKPMYNYLFSHQSSVSIGAVLGSPENLGVAHGDDLMYLFNIADTIYPNREETEDDIKVRKIMTKLWENFARTGNPTPEIDDLIKKKWEPIKSEKLEYYHIDAKVQEMKEALLEERVKFWKTLPLQPMKSVKEEL